MIKFGISNLGVFEMCLVSARGPDISATPYPRLAAKTCLQNLLAKLFHSLLGGIYPSIGYAHNLQKDKRKP